ncbi:hypothetical protein [Methylophaga thiooxydans]|uniref:Uncharacterized protein n=3 Tax=Methylophaga thiooxydans DMS010 TaxID=637616 RepID=C0N2E6_9GAMM|nr:hypothetical protein [Methylophaga thiooxydans]EEF78429.1 hypothetical protein MDMS009_2973 [Methylophaga thiooxydans DMS010]EEF78817.1 hypothetical protein MDMS009_2561 [Methylophaga thiooxydans DMS010]EEF79110.1 hypothetical protein MDMS009_2370 [Methylophaga thiooxydans DMS010]EEF79713.1 hypothetical protein MDMS009_1651 [Methylophaga thiooxydans DMS010]EEF80162.1 hypothetical protein MDMS009_1319 [Methylophaga thiooxydans DMS010]
MITLNTEKGLIRVDSWGDIQDLAGFEENLDPSDHKLKEILGNYTFTEKIRCGLSTCHSPHNKGYIVSTEDGYTTNIGQLCGASYFGVEFNTLSKRFDRFVTESENRATLREFDIDSVQQQVSELKAQEKGANWANSKLSPFKQNKFPTISKALSSMIKTRSNQLIITVKATVQEVEAIEAAQNVTLERPHYVERPVAEIAGLEALYDENDIRELVVIQLESNLNQLRDADINQLSYQDLEKWAKWVREVDSLVSKATQIILFARVFLTRENLKPLDRLGGSYDESSAFTSYIKQLK